MSPDGKRAGAILASLLFVVQMLLSSWAMAASAGQPMVDAFGNVLCVTDPSGHPTQPGKDHGAIPACCAVGCSVAVSALAAPDTASVRLALGPEHATERPQPPAVVIAAENEHDPGSPRAPPLKD